MAKYGQIDGELHEDIREGREGWVQCSSPSLIESTLRKSISLILYLSITLYNVVGKSVIWLGVYIIWSVNSSIIRMMIETTESVLCSPELQQLQLKFKEITLQMQTHAKEGKYVLAESCRVNAEQIKKQLQGKKVTEVEKRQKKENQEVKKLLKDQLADFNQEWDAKINQYIWESKKWVADLKDKQAKEKQQWKEKLQLQIPQKWKDSSECLNLKKIEQGLAKQQNYVQALKVQKQVRELQKKEQDAWCKIRNEKMEAGMDQLKARQEVQMKALQKRLESGKAELQIERIKAEGRLVLKHANVSKDIQSQNKKQYLSTKGDFKSRVEVLSPNKSRMLSPNSRSKLLLSMTR